MAGSSRSRQFAALAVGRSIGTVSSLWGRVGLGTLFQAAGRASGLRGVEAPVRLPTGGLFEVPVFDGYWGPTVVGGRAFEPEVGIAFQRFRAVRPVLVDCGANFGYWSVMGAFGDQPYPNILSIEANPTTYDRLVRNAALNGGRFEPIWAAVSDVSGRTVFLGGTDAHAEAHVADDGEVEVTTIAIDGALAERGLDNAAHVVIKLDVEGHEITALRGASQTLQRDHAIVFEDWEANDFHVVTELIRLGDAVYYVSQKGDVAPLRHAGDARDVTRRDHKISKSRNFVAVKPGGDLERLLRG